MQSEDDQWVSPSFSSYSSNRSADIAVKVIEETNGEEIKFSEENLYIIDEDGEDNNNDEEEQEEDEEFEFSLVEDEIYFDGQPRPIFPIFNRDLLIDSRRKVGNVEENAIRIPLKKLFIDEREGREPPSSEEEDECELESMPPGTYCIWKAKTPEQSSSRCKKSKSTGSGSKRPWKLLDLLRRSNSDGKDSFVFLTPKKKEEKHEKKKWKVKTSSSSSSTPSSPLHYAFARNKATITKGNETPSRSTRPKGSETPRRKTYLPYRQDLVGFFATVNGFSRNFTPF